MVLLDDLESIAFLRELAPAHLQKLSALARLKEVEAEGLIFGEGEHSPYIYLVLEGEVGLEIRVPRFGGLEVLTLGPGELLGWSPVLGGSPMTATARATTRCRLAAFNAEQVLALAEHDPRFGMEFFRGTSAALAERLYATRQQIANAGRGKFHALREAAD
jgi:CRP-like cAMP-binding protein